VLSERLREWSHGPRIVALGLGLGDEGLDPALPRGAATGVRRVDAAEGAGMERALEG